MLEEFRNRVHYIHDVECNQKYGEGLPYSFHLKAVESQFDKFSHLLPVNYAFSNSTDLDVFKAACILHDSIEDARMTWNDVWKLSTSYCGNMAYCDLVADIVYCLTDEKGINRAERKNDKYYQELKRNKYAVFIKLCDIAANTLYSKLTGSSMYNKYKKEFPHFKEKVYKEEYKELFDYVENL